MAASSDPVEQWWGIWKHLDQWKLRPLSDLTSAAEDLVTRGVSVGCKASGYMYDGMTALHFAAQYCVNAEWGLDLLEYLLRKEEISDLVNEPDDKYGLTPLLHALANGAQSTDVHGVLTGQEAVEDDDGHQRLPPADAAGRRKLLQALDLFLEHDSDINFVPFTSNGQPSSSASSYTALGIAAAKSDINLLVRLIRAGARVNVKRRSSDTIEDYPVVHPLYTAALHGNTDICKLLIEFGACTDPGNNQNTVIHAAAYAHNQDLIELFVKCGADINCTDSIGETALFTAVRSYDVPTVKALLSHGADVNAVDRYMGNALATLCTMNVGRRADKKEVLQCLLDAGCNIDQRGFRGHNALHHAARVGDDETALILLQSGANPNILTDSGLRAIHVAFCNHTLTPSYWRTIKHLIHYNSELSHQAGNGNCRFLCPCEEDCHIQAIHMLYLAGCSAKDLRALGRGPPGHHANRLLFQLQSTPLGLQESCRKAIRKQFDYKTVDRIDKLPLPDVLLNYVKFSDLNFEAEEAPEE